MNIISVYNKLINLKKNIENHLVTIKVENFNCIISIDQNITIKSVNFNYESFIENEESSIYFQIFKDKKQYIFSVKGFDNLENIINEIPTVMETMEPSEFYDNQLIFHEIVSFEKTLYEPSLIIPNEIINNFVNEIKLINEKENRNILENINIDNSKNYKLFFNKGGYEHYRHTESSSYSIWLTEEDRGNKYTDYEYETFIKPINEKAIIEKISNRLKKEKEKIDLPIGKYNVIFPNKFSYKLITMIIKGLYGDVIWRKKSFLINKIGKKIFGDNINIIEDPNLENSISNSFIDMEANKIIKKYLVKNGVIETMLLNKEYGEKFKLPPTGNSWNFSIGYTNIYLEPGSYDNLLKETNECIVLNSIIGSGFQVTTGEISISITGFYYKGEKFQGSITGTLNGNIIDLLKDCLIGKDIDYNQHMAPSILVKNMTFAPGKE